jgi:predicted Zn-dependent protease with MMP-like domain
MEIMNKEEFEEIILKTLENIPEKFKKKLDNLSIVIEENEMIYTGGQNIADKRLTLGLYHGVPITIRPGKRIMMPDKITIYKKTLESISSSREELEKNTRRVVLHELGHYFGLGEDRLHELGY